MFYLKKKKNIHVKISWTTKIIVKGVFQSNIFVEYLETGIFLTSLKKLNNLRNKMKESF